jgi:hypothetical protein
MHTRNVSFYLMSVPFSCLNNYVLIFSCIMCTLDNVHVKIHTEIVRSVCPPVWLHFKAGLTSMKSDMDVMPIHKSKAKVVPMLN